VLSHQTATSVSALVRFEFSDKTKESLAIDLVKVGQGWRIAEMTDSDHQTFTAQNVQALKDAGH
jgi:hypothetical protein